jgi:Protein of unknown function (DUF732)
MKARTLILTVCTAASVALAAAAPQARADEIAYLVNVTVRPGYNFANAQHALDYGRGVCAKIGAGVSYRALIGDIKRDFRTEDEYQASYLISQSAQELCPALVWQVRRSAGGYTPGSP